jgi:hypothetical protein
MPLLWARTACEEGACRIDGFRQYGYSAFDCWLQHKIPQPRVVQSLVQLYYGKTQPQSVDLLGISPQAVFAANQITFHTFLKSLLALQDWLESLSAVTLKW